MFSSVRGVGFPGMEFVIAGDGIAGPGWTAGNFPDSVITDDGICARS